jgi:hypothetical protein
VPVGGVEQNLIMVMEVYYLVSQVAGKVVVYQLSDMSTKYGKKSYSAG